MKNFTWICSGIGILIIIGSYTYSEYQSSVNYFRFLQVQKLLTPPTLKPISSPKPKKTSSPTSTPQPTPTPKTLITLDEIIDKICKKYYPLYTIGRSLSTDEGPIANDIQHYKIDCLTSSPDQRYLYGSESQSQPSIEIYLRKGTYQP